MANFLTTTMKAIADKTGISKYWAYDTQQYKPEYQWNHYINSNGASDNQNILSARPVSLPKVRELYRNNLVVRSIINTCSDNVVADDFKITSDIPGDQNKELNDMIEKDWNFKFAPYSDASEQQTITEQMETLFKRFLADGDSFAVIVKPSEGKTKYKTKIRLVDQMNVMNPNGVDSDNIQQGIETDAFGDKVKVYFTFNNGKAETSYSFTDADGMTQVVQLLDQSEGVGITRGLPMFMSASYSTVLELNEFMKSELNAAFFASKLNLVHKTDNSKARSNVLNANAKQAGQTQTTSQAPTIYTTPGLVNYIRKEDELTQFKFDRPQGAFDAYCMEQKRNVCASIGLSYEFCFHDVTDFNSAGARFNSMCDQMKIKKWQKQLVTKFLKPVKEHFVEEFFAVNDLPLPEGMDLSDVCDCINFIPPRFISVDEQKDTQTSQMKIDAGLSTHQLECSKNGLDYEEVFAQLAREIELKKKLGITEVPPEDTNGIDKPDKPKDGGGSDLQTATGEVPKPEGSGPGRIPNENSSRVA